MVGFGGDGRECGCCGGGGGFYCGVGDCGGILKNIVIHLYAVYETGVLEDMICGRKFMFFKGSEKEKSNFQVLYFFLTGYTFLT